ncbi:uncharacterized protein KQ657_004849 [Scheffersomyces spartinae]|uniref:Zn(2)-C6 fungal-type domain-containing protein n=1 Tax=Scheffersomyces spartinae TaxID=45513 RepID=A0A9P7V9Y4_9ASCO|nr:uncharacterized protein KQ657_004849 [Scheffersomyces spartinae]KAG7194141.1 hypothetical protein KQ657_004849 [Scheffersomyces spartinae]
MSGLYLPSKNNPDNINSVYGTGFLPTPSSQSSVASTATFGQTNSQTTDRLYLNTSATPQSMLNNQLPSIPSKKLTTSGERKEPTQISQIDSLIPNIPQLIPHGLYTAPPQNEDMGYQLYLNYMGDYPSGEIPQQYLAPPQSNASPISNTANHGRYPSSIPPTYPNYSLSPSLGRAAPEHGASSPSTAQHQHPLGQSEYENNVDHGFGTSPSSNVYMIPGNTSNPTTTTRNSIQNLGLYVMAGPNTVNPVPVTHPSTTSMFPSNNTQHPLLNSSMYISSVGSKGSSLAIPNKKEPSASGGSLQNPPSQLADHQNGMGPNSKSIKKGKVRKGSMSATSSTRYSGSNTNGQAKPPAKRSRMGCLTCRQRKKRCCETRPRCTECARLKLNCVWPIPGSEHKNKPKEVKNNEQTIDHEIYGKIKVLRGIVEYRSK